MSRAIKNKQQQESYLARAYELVQGELSPNSAESDQLEVISILIEAYENEPYTIDALNPIEAILFRLDQLGLPKSELGRLLGTRSRASELLAA